MGHLKAKCFNLIIRQYPLNISVDKTVDIVCGIMQQIQSMNIISGCVVTVNMLINVHVLVCSHQYVVTVKMLTKV